MEEDSGEQMKPLLTTVRIKLNLVFVSGKLSRGGSAGRCARNLFSVDVRERKAERDGMRGTGGVLG